ncbi:ABC transporter ATP-binding protein [Lachnobacterium bovis]|uniref:ABC transporter ATP-binding protein n=1 Tax=Lachnobacterium bovis TaxID=140626 RepID=UPI0003B39372|nr:ABC transporter ATP-binding protein [Lachnobacterium bovis]
MEEKVVVKVSNLQKTFKISKKQQKIQNTKEKTITAVNGLDFEVRQGEIFGLLGPNGAGKTTTLRMLSTLIKPDKGSININGLDVKKNSQEVRSQIGFLTNELKLEGFFTPNYLFDFFSDMYSIDEGKRGERKAELFSKFGIDKFKEVKIDNMSTGMKQKVSIVISLVHDPDIIIFDEPTNGLDVITAKVVTDFLKEQRDKGKTIILSTHIFSLVDSLCDHVGIILDGKMIEQGQIEDVKAGKSLEDKFFEIYVREKGREE